jgi:hypothetical protein
MPVVVACEGSDFPFCGGFCPPGSTCGPFTNGVCGCVHDPQPPCQQSGAPQCNGYCPPDSACTVFHGNCICLGCIGTGTGPGDVGGVSWTSTTRLTWDPEACASSYSVYQRTTVRLADLDHDGVADDYGTCYVPNTEVREVHDMTSPPVGQTRYFIVTARDPDGEGTMGYTSSGLERENNSPCP